jgi:molybdate transport repressor ModE-like protein
MEPRAKLWLEIDGRIALSEWRVRLLEAVAETGSLARASEQVGIPYRTATHKLREIEDNLGVRLLETHSGGSDGGFSRLTPDGVDLVRRWRAFNADLDAWVDERFRAAFVD